MHKKLDKEKETNIKQVINSCFVTRKYYKEKEKSLKDEIGHEKGKEIGRCHEF